MKMYITTTTITPLLLLLVRSSFGDEITLSSENDFTEFVNDVNSGKTNYSEDTVFLGSDIALPESIDPIGINYTHQFLGIFDGQGHIISNLAMNSSSQYTGLFGYSAGLTIRNVVLDDSCSITSSFKGSGSEQGHVGGIIGYCDAINGECSIENSVNMANVTFSGNISNNLYIGGVVGKIASSSDYAIYVKNCVNYGSVTDSGTVRLNYAELGGIVGISGGSLAFKYIQNCLNYGTITHNGTSANLYIGGIVGNSARYACIENCVSAGEISTQTKATKGNFIGSIVGKVDSSDTFINYCYYTSDVNVSSIYGTGSPESTAETPNSPTDVGSELVSKLNSNATSCNWGKWFMLHLNGGSINNLTQELLIGIQGHIPNPVKEGNSFLFWCKDAECTEEFDPEAESVSGITALYAGWASGIVTFDFGNGTTVNVTFSYNTEIIYPKDLPEKEGYTLSWDNYRKLMPARDITVTAQWTPNNYTVTFDTNGGDVSETSKTVTFNEKYGELPKSKRAGYVFFGWLLTNEANGTEVTNETIVVTAYNHTLYARWEEVTNYVEIVFSKKDLANEDVEELIEKYANTEFTIVKYENGSEGIRVIVGFVDKEDAENFITNIEESSEMSMVKRIGFVIDDPGSLSTMIYPLSLFNAFFL